MKRSKKPPKPASVRTPQQARARATMDKLLAAARELLAEKSFEDVTVRAVVRRARSSLSWANPIRLSRTRSPFCPVPNWLSRTRSPGVSRAATKKPQRRSRRRQPMISSQGRFLLRPSP